MLRAVPELPPDQVTALQAVDLRLHFGTHGYSLFETAVGPMMTGISDTEYAHLGHIAAELQPGDVLAIEASGFKEQPTISDTVDAILGIARRSPFIDFPYSDIKRDWSFGPWGWHTHIEGEGPPREQLAALLEEMRAKWVFSPFTYAAGLAIMRGATCVRADATREELAQWHDSHRLLDSEVFFRSRKMVERLGETALSMRPAGAWPPRLDLIAGSSKHPRQVGSILRANGVDFQVDYFTPNPVKSTVRTLAGFFGVPGLRPTQRWKRNLGRVSRDRQ
jgi:hypothetical protein